MEGTSAGSYLNVPNVPCGVERSFMRCLLNLVIVLFLMYRVELKVVRTFNSFSSCYLRVPNVPCGVESSFFHSNGRRLFCVPNVPCGVESKSSYYSLIVFKRFLMYRVELKGKRSGCGD